MTKILIVEDDLLIQKMYYQKFLDEGFSLLLANNGRECIDKTRSEHPDLILLDLHLPGMDGIAALRQLKGAEETKHIPVAVLTAMPGSIAENIPDTELAKQVAAYWEKSEMIPSQVVEGVKTILAKIPQSTANIVSEKGGENT